MTIPLLFIGYVVGITMGALSGAHINAGVIAVGGLLTLSVSLLDDFVVKPWRSRRAEDKRVLDFLIQEVLESEAVGVKGEECDSPCTLAPLTLSLGVTSKSSKVL